MAPGERNLMLLFLVMSVGAGLFALDLVLPEARLFPLITGITTAGLILLYFVVSTVPWLRQHLAIYVEDDVFLKISGVVDALEEEAEDAAEVTHAENGLPDEIRHQREFAIIALLVGLGMLALLVGLTIATPVFMLAVMIGYSRRPWWLALTVTAVTTLFIYFVFSVVLRLPPHFGLLEALL